MVVKDGEIIGEGYHPQAGLPHAEVFALEQAGAGAKGSVLYVTLEPCCHYGRTPPCVEAIIESGARRVVAAMTDPNPKVRGRGLDALRKAGIDVTVGVLENEARVLNEAYVKYITTGFPFVTLKMAMTLDGKIATRTGDSKWVSGEEARRVVHRLRSMADALVIGAGTLRQDDPALTVRYGSRSRQPARIIVDARARVSPESQVFRSPGGQVIVATTRSADARRLRKLEAAGARILVVEEADGRVDVAALFRSLAEMGLINVMLEGGGELSASALAAKAVDKVVLFIAPKIIGGRAAKTPVEGEGLTKMADALLLVDVKTRRCGEDLMVVGRPSYPPS